jgi:hypothetical protein
MVSIARQHFCDCDLRILMTSKLRPFSFLILLFCIYARAQDAASPTGAFAGLVSVNVSLKARIYSKDVKLGQAVIATVEDPATVGGTVLARGTILVGRVVSVTRHGKESPDGSISILFEQAKPKKGEPININASIFKILPSENMLLAQRSDVSGGLRGTGASDANTPLLRQNTDKADHTMHGTESAAGAPVQVLSGIEGVALSAVASGSSSGIMTSKNHDVELPASMDMVVGVSLKQ